MSLEGREERRREERRTIGTRAGLGREVLAAIEMLEVSIW